jgi:hypothetical protein
MLEVYLHSKLLEWDAGKKGVCIFVRCQILLHWGCKKPHKNIKNSWTLVATWEAEIRRITV